MPATLWLDYKTSSLREKSFFLELKNKSKWRVNNFSLLKSEISLHFDWRYFHEYLEWLFTPKKWDFTPRNLESKISRTMGEFQRSLVWYAISECEECVKILRKVYHSYSAICTQIFASFKVDVLVSWLTCARDRGREKDRKK